MVVKYFFPLVFVFGTLQSTVLARQEVNVNEELERLYAAADFEACAALAEPVSAFVSNRVDTLASNACFRMGDAAYQLGDVALAAQWWEKEKALLHDLNLEEGYANTLANLASAYVQLGNYAKASSLADELLALDTKRYKPDDLEFIEYSLYTVAEIYWKTDRLKEAERLLTQYLKQQKKGSLQAGYIQSKLGDLYTYKGELTKAENCLNEALAIFQRDLNEYASPYVNTLVNLGILNMEQGKLTEAEAIFDEALQILDQQDVSYIPLVNNQANLYYRLGQYEKAIDFFDQVKKQDSLLLGETHPDYALTLSNMAMAFNDNGDADKAEKLMLQSIDISKQNADVTSSDYASKLNNLARVYQRRNQHQQALQLYAQAEKLFLKTVGPKSPEYATAVFNLGVAWWKVKDIKKAERYLKKSLTLRASVLGKRHPKYAESQEKLAELQWSQKNKKEVRQTFGAVFDNYYFQIESVFPALTEEEKATFYYNKVQPSFEKYNSFAMAYKQESPDVLGELFDQQLNTKAVIMLATDKVREAIASSKDELLIQNFERWQDVKELVAKAYSQNQSPNITDSLLTIANGLEKDLARKSQAFARQFLKQRYSWKQVRDKLLPGQAAIEVVRYRSFSPEEGGAFSDDVNYAFLIVTPATQDHPEILTLKDGEILEGRHLSYYKNSILFGQEDKYSFNLYFGLLDDYLKANKLTSLIISPSGVYNQINLNTLYDTETGQYVIDEYDIRLVTTCRELLEEKALVNITANNVLVGYPTYNLDSTYMAADGAGTRSVSRGVSRGLRGGLQRFIGEGAGISVLPGTAVEIQKISNLTTAKQTNVYREANASELIVKQVEHPTVLHIATHGYFLEDETRADEGFVGNPMLKSGLILAGAENFIRTGVPVDSTGNDGVLTAYEAMNMNLEGTQLVVLSACETGLGVVKNGEGVYGLQRAFKLGGAKCIVMSLWNVDDEATQDLMILFYAEVLKSGDAQASFLTAQRELKNKYPLPSHWGAFVLTGI